MPHPPHAWVVDHENLGACSLHHGHLHAATWPLDSTCSPKHTSQSCGGACDATLGIATSPCRCRSPRASQNMSSDMPWSCLQSWGPSPSLTCPQPGLDHHAKSSYSVLKAKMAVLVPKSELQIWSWNVEEFISGIKKVGSTCSSLQPG